MKRIAIRRRARSVGRGLQRGPRRLRSVLSRTQSPRRPNAGPVFAGRRRRPLAPYRPKASSDHFRDGEDHRGHRHHWDDDEDDDDDGSASADRGGANRSADPNAANAPVPDSGIFNGKARPKVEVQ